MSYLWYWPDGGWDFDMWKRRQRWRPIATEQSGRREPLPLVTNGATRAAWERQARAWRRTSDEILGKLRDRKPRRMRWEFLGDALAPQRRGRGTRSPYTMRRLRYTLTAREFGYAWLLTPASRRSKGSVIALHQTAPNGKAVPVRLEPVPEAPDGTYYAAELAERGFAVLAPDQIAFGERQAAHRNARYRSADEFYAAHPDGSVMAKMAYDTARAVDLLRALPGVDGERIGCVGHSHGAYGTLFAMVADDRIRAGVASCGINLLRDDPGVDRWWRRTALIPRLGLYEGRIVATPIDFHHWLALVAPRPFMLVAALRDHIYPNTGGLAAAVELVRGVYDLYGAGERLVCHAFDGPHAFAAAARRRAYAMLERELR
jgi:dienelactone hydrolase